MKNTKYYIVRIDLNFNWNIVTQIRVHMIAHSPVLEQTLQKQVAVLN
jgi:hypothetical protein